MAMPGLWLVLGMAVTLMISIPCAKAFSLIGPCADWMETTIGYRLPGDIGGPMDLNEEYRWNVPIVTYGFDQSFLDFFGTNGVRAVEEAIKTLSALPPASKIVLTNYPLDTRRINSIASEQGLYDLKSATLALLLEQMGLASPSQNVFDLRRWDPVFFTSHPDEQSWPEGIPYYVLLRNFDPITCLPSLFVNNTLYAGTVLHFPEWAPGISNVADIVEIAVDPLASAFSAVMDVGSHSGAYLIHGEFFTGLTRDDVGGLRYLLRKDNINFERLLPGTRGNRPDGAWRQGVEKIVFVRQPYVKHFRRFLPVICRFPSSYMNNGRAKQQQVVRVVTQPDFLFCAADTGENNSDYFPPLFVRTGTTNWVNCAAINGGATNAGPGVIQPPVKITFHKMSDFVASRDDYWAGGVVADVVSTKWGSFNDTTNPPIVYPSGLQNTNNLTVRFSYWSGNNQVAGQTWHLMVPVGGQAVLETSTNQTDWSLLCTVTNSGGIIEWRYSGSPDPERFFRVVPSDFLPEQQVGFIGAERQ